MHKNLREKYESRLAGKAWINGVRLELPATFRIRNMYGIGAVLVAVLVGSSVAVIGWSCQSVGGTLLRPASA